MMKELQLRIDYAVEARGLLVQLGFQSGVSLMRVLRCGRCEGGGVVATVTESLLLALERVRRGKLLY